MGLRGCGSSTIEGGFESKASLVTVKPQIGDVREGQGFAGVRESYGFMDRVHAELEVGLEWSVVRLCETEKKKEKTHWCKGENDGNACKSVGWSSEWRW